MTSGAGKGGAGSSGPASSTNASSTNASSTNASSTNASSTNASSTNASSTNASSTNASSTDSLPTDVAAGGSAGHAASTGGSPSAGTPANPTSTDGADPGPAPAAGSHGFSWVLVWTVIGSVLPGLGLIVAGWRKAGAVLLALVVLALAGVAFWVLSGDILERGLSFAVDPGRLLVLAVGAVVAGVLWALLILLTGSQLRRRAVLGRWQKVFSWVVVAVLVVGVGVPAYAVADYSLVQRDLVTTVFNSADDADVDVDDAKPDAVAADPWAGTDRINVLLIGSDAGKTREGIRPDTLIVASIQPSSGNTVLFSLPRNLERVPFKKNSPGAAAWPDGYYCADDSCLLNAVWTWALDAPGYAKYKNPGLQATEDAVTGVTGLEIDTYVMLNLKGFEEFIDAVGGVTLNVYERLPIGGDSEHPEETIGYLEPGMNQEMDGWHALWFARSRWSTSDYDRMRRQRCVIAAVTDQADPVTLARNFTKIAKALKSNMSTAIPQSDLQAWVELATRVQGAQVTSLPFTDDVVPDRTDPDYGLIHRQVSKAIRTSEQAAAEADATATPSASATASATSSATASATASAGSTATASPTVSPTAKARSTAEATTRGTDGSTGKNGDKNKNQKDDEETDPTSAQDVTEVC
ncbi:LCP family protein [Kineosporia sp. J2-2]|uniref:LCP family protein n=1 Tax=Kineosporia corallincola TaxID=2835133 RepID=A0ABS5TK79_9ACTN|nr:LCP family protein [Kineosporia corallincola]MBT0771502.1 LCP family protein [Kineosporia corallincola]